MSRYSSPNVQYMAADGEPLIGGFLYFYLTGTSTLEATYSDSGLTIANPNPIILDQNGYAGSIFLQIGVLYKVVLADANGVQQWTEDPVGDSTSGGTSFNSPLEVTAADNFTKQVIFQTASVNRASIGVDASPETGSNAGSNGAILTYDDAGALLASVMTWNRATGIADFTSGPPTSGGAPLVPPQVPTGRLTLATGTPVMATTVAGATTIYYTPYLGEFYAPIYNGTYLVWTNLVSELSQATTDTTNSPAAVADNSVYDLFVWLKAGVPTLSRGPAWTNSTTRALALQRVNGIWTNGAAITNGPAINQGTYVGTVASNGSAEIDWILGGAASGGTAASLGVWNMYNRVLVGVNVVDSGSIYTSIPSSYQQARASAGNQISFVSGLAEDAILANYAGNAELESEINLVDITLGIGLDSVTSASAASQIGVSGQNNSYVGIWYQSFSIALAVPPQLGSHYVAALEKASATSSIYNDSASANQLSALLRM